MVETLANPLFVPPSTGPEQGGARTSSVVITSIFGGLGNQMFQYAMARRLAHRHGVELKLDLSSYRGGAGKSPSELKAFQRTFGLSQFLITASEATEAQIARLRDPFSCVSMKARCVRRIRRIAPRFLWPSTHVCEREYRFDSKMLDLPPNVYLQGFWQSEKYFADIAPVIRDEFSFQDPGVGRYAAQYVERLRELGGAVVSLHVRRGDLARAHEDLKRPDLVHGPPVSLGYIAAAIERFPGCRFLVFSDSPADIAWCRQNIQAERLHFSEGHSDIQDLAIMTACDHHIIANSTYSWWAGWLDCKPGRRVVSPRRWSIPGTPAQMVVDDLIPSDWEIL